MQSSAAAFISPSEKKNFEMKVLKLYPDSIVPTRATSDSAEFDLCARGDPVAIRHNKSVAIELGISVAIPRGHVGMIKSHVNLVPLRLSVKEQMIVSGGLEPLVLVLRNDSPWTFTCIAGAPVARLLIIPLAVPEIIVVNGTQTCMRYDRDLICSDEVPRWSLPEKDDNK